ncbi:MAG: ComEC/Rec2 family competence protein [Acetobacterales bacterium]
MHARLGNDVSPIRSVAAEMAAQQERWPLWIPVLLGCGIAAYFALRQEPSLWLGPAVLVTGIGAALALRRRQGGLLAAVAFSVVAAGFGLAQWRAHAVAAPVVGERTVPVTVAGRIVAVDGGSGYRRVVLDELSIGRLDTDRTPARVRIRINGTQPLLRPGDRIEARAILLPPPAPSAPGAYDFQRRAWFERLGAVGFALGQPKLLQAGAEDGTTLWLERLRQTIHRRILAAAPGPEGAVASALLTGEREAIPEAVLDDMRDSGLAHLLAISGLHLGMVAGLVFFSVRGLLAGVEGWALRHDVKKWAAAVALVAAAAYMVLTGATVPTQRAFLMTGLVLLAVMFDRSALSMRLVAWAALAVLLWRPESLLGASFQLSFAAVTALIAAYEALRERLADWRGGLWSAPWPVAWAGVLGMYLAGVCLTTVIAGSATAPFAAYHFNRLALYGVLGNMIAVPLTAFWIMPAGLLVYALMPLGLEGWALEPMAAGTERLLQTAAWVAGLPGAASPVPAMPQWALAAITLGGLWLTLWRGRIRLAGIVPLLAGVLSPLVAPAPDVLVSGDARLVAVKRDDGGMAFSSLRRGGFDREVWLRRAGTGDASDWTVDGARCDLLGCMTEAAGRRIAVVRDGRALDEDCRVADIVVSLVPVRRPCPSALHVVDRFDLWREGAHAIWLQPGGARVLSVDAVRGARPWVPRRENVSTGAAAP